MKTFLTIAALAAIGALAIGALSGVDTAQAFCFEIDKYGCAS